MVLEGGELHGSRPPAEAALASDLAIHGCFAAVSAGLEAALAGVPTVMIDNEGFRSNVGIILVDQRSHLFWARRVGKRGWQFPQGGVDKDETPEQAMFRELEEEVGLKPGDVELLGSTAGWLRYRLPRRYMRKNSKPLCIGQKQRWFLLRMLADDGKVKVDGGEHPEFDHWRWEADLWTPIREVIYFKRHVYDQALTELGRILYPESLPPLPEWLEAMRARRRSRGR